jgi:hypothetical protein
MFLGRPVSNAANKFGRSALVHEIMEDLYAPTAHSENIAVYRVSQRFGKVDIRCLASKINSLSTNFI